QKVMRISEHADEFESDICRRFCQCSTCSKKDAFLIKRHNEIELPSAMHGPNPFNQICQLFNFLTLKCPNISQIALCVSLLRYVKFRYDSDDSMDYSEFSDSEEEYDREELIELPLLEWIQNWPKMTTLAL